MTRSKRVVIRCDATAETGLGHLVRAVSVAQAARENGWDVVMTGTVTSKLGIEVLSKADIRVVVANDDLFGLTRKYKADVVHIDSYAIGVEALADVHRAGAILSSMEDGTFARRPADLVIDSSVGAERAGSVSMMRPNDGSGVVLRGVRYAPMRPQVLRARAERAATYRDTTTIDAIIVMGGTDATGATATIATVCQSTFGISSVTVIAPVHLWESIRESAGDVRLIVPDSEFLQLAARADLVVSAAGTTTWELACMGVPIVIVAVTENQYAGYQAVVDSGIARGLGTIDEVRADPTLARSTIERAAADLRAGQTWTDIGMMEVDGLGAQRIVDAWVETLAGRAPRAYYAT